MLIEPQSPTRYAVFEEDPADCREVGLSLAEAFHSIMAHCAFEPIWDLHGNNLRLRFRYLDEPFKGHFVGSLQGSSVIESYEAPSFGGNASRDRIMKSAVSAGLRGWYAEPMAEFYRDSAAALAREFQHSGEKE